MLINLIKMTSYNFTQRKLRLVQQSEFPALVLSKHESKSKESKSYLDYSKIKEELKKGEINEDIQSIITLQPLPYPPKLVVYNKECYDWSDIPKFY